MDVRPEVLERARKLKSDAIVELLELFYSRVHRMAHGLCGSETAARQVVRTVMRQSLPQIPKFKHEDAPERWFHHHTILATRKYGSPKQHPRYDTLVLDPIPDPQYLAFIAAIRKLPFQQREAYLLRHGEGFEVRQIGIAMDYSTEASSQHLRVAEAELQKVAGERYGVFEATVSNAYQRYAPAPQIILPAVSTLVAFYSWPRRIGRFVAFILVIAIIVGIVAIIWYLWDRVVV